MAMPSTIDLIASLRSARCPMCGEGKREAQTMCVRCYRKLPFAVQARLYHRVGNGYELAFAEAMAHLGVDTIFLPAKASA